LFQENNYLVIPTYLALDEILVNWDSIDPKPWIPKATGSGSSIPRKFLPENLKAFIKSRTDKHELEILEGLQTARTLVQMRKDARERGLDDPITGAVEQKTNPPETTECQCCFADDQIDNMIHCNGEVVHVSTFSTGWRLYL
jgi:hypothetical protein